MDNYRQANRNMWDEFALIHASSNFYGVEEFKRGCSSLDSLVLSEMGEVVSKSFLHLQCHFGLDTLSWAREGAQVTGMDFSSEGIRIARGLAEELNIPARFICCDLYDLPEHLDETFDRVYTSYGVLCWLPDIPRWAQIVGHFLKPGGVFYIAEFHPFSNMFKNDGDETSLEMAYPYFNTEPLEFPVDGSYADPQAKIEQKVEYEWSPRMGEIITGLIDAGLRIEFVHLLPPFPLPGGEGGGEVVYAGRDAFDPADVHAKGAEGVMVPAREGSQSLPAWDKMSVCQAGYLQQG
jgi:SAM-dependent methyltransferase